MSLVTPASSEYYEAPFRSPTSSVHDRTESSEDEQQTVEEYEGELEEGELEDEEEDDEEDYNYEDEVIQTRRSTPDLAPQHHDIPLAPASSTTPSITPFVQV